MPRIRLHIHTLGHRAGDEIDFPDGIRLEGMVKGRKATIIGGETAFVVPPKPLSSPPPPPRATPGRKSPSVVTAPQAAAQEQTDDPEPIDVAMEDEVELPLEQAPPELTDGQRAALEVLVISESQVLLGGRTNSDGTMVHHAAARKLEEMGLAFIVMDEEGEETASNTIQGRRVLEAIL